MRWRIAGRGGGRREDAARGGRWRGGAGPVLSAVAARLRPQVPEAGRARLGGWGVWRVTWQPRRGGWAASAVLGRDHHTSVSTSKSAFQSLRGGVACQPLALPASSSAPSFPPAWSSLLPSPQPHDLGFLGWGESLLLKARNLPRPAWVVGGCFWFFFLPLPCWTGLNTNPHPHPRPPRVSLPLTYPVESEGFGSWIPPWLISVLSIYDVCQRLRGLST